MKTWELVFRVFDKNRFEEIRRGKKKFETRAATEKYKPMKAGDTILFVCDKDTFEKQIKSAHIFASPEEMIKQIPLKEIMPDVDTLEDMKKRYASYPNYPEKIKRFGLIALELE